MQKTVLHPLMTDVTEGLYLASLTTDIENRDANQDYDQVVAEEDNLWVEQSHSPFVHPGLFNGWRLFVTNDLDQGCHKAAPHLKNAASKLTYTRLVPAPSMSLATWTSLT